MLRAPWCGRYPSWSTVASTRARAASPTRPLPLSTFDTVDLPTPAARATSMSVTFRLVELTLRRIGDATGSPFRCQEKSLLTLSAKHVLTLDMDRFLITGGSFHHALPGRFGPAYLPCHGRRDERCCCHYGYRETSNDGGDVQPRPAPPGQDRVPLPDPQPYRRGAVPGHPGDLRHGPEPDPMEPAHPDPVGRAQQLREHLPVRRLRSFAARDGVLRAAEHPGPDRARAGTGAAAEQQAHGQRAYPGHLRAALPGHAGGHGRGVELVLLSHRHDQPVPRPPRHHRAGLAVGPSHRDARHRVRQHLAVRGLQPAVLPGGPAGDPAEPV